MEHNIQSIDNYKNILRDAVSVSGQLSIKTKQEILEFKGKLQDYIKLVNDYVVRPPDIASDQVWEEGIESETQMGFLQEDLNRIGSEISKEVAVVKNTYQ